MNTVIKTKVFKDYKRHMRIFSIFGIELQIMIKIPIYKNRLCLEAGNE